MPSLRPHYSLTCLVPPALEPVTLAEAKLFLRVDHDTEDTLISMLVQVAREKAEHYCRRSFITQDRQITFIDNAPASIVLPYSPVRSVLEVVTTDEAGSETTIPAEAMTLYPESGVLRFDSEITGVRIHVRYRCGYGDFGSDVPASIRHAVLLHCASLYDDRSQEAIPSASLRLLQEYREVRL